MKCETKMCRSSDCYESGCGTSCSRKFLTTEEKIAKLNDYKDWLDNESKGVHEAIQELKKAS